MTETGDTQQIIDQPEQMPMTPIAPATNEQRLPLPSEVVPTIPATPDSISLAPHNASDSAPIQFVRPPVDEPGNEASPMNKSQSINIRELAAQAPTQEVQTPMTQALLPATMQPTSQTPTESQSLFGRLRSLVTGK